LNPSSANSTVIPSAPSALILQSIIGRPDDTADEHLATPEDAMRLGTDAFATCTFVCRFGKRTRIYDGSSVPKTALFATALRLLPRGASRW